MYSMVIVHNLQNMSLVVLLCLTFDKNLAQHSVDSLHPMFVGSAFIAISKLLYVLRLGLHLTETAAAKAYDRVAIKKWGPREAIDKINFPLEHYNLQELEDITMTELVNLVRSKPTVNLHMKFDIIDQTHAD